MMPYITELEQLVGKKRYRKILKKEYEIEQCRNRGIDRLAQSLMESPRIHCGENDWDSYTEYGFLHGVGYTDEDLDEIREDMRLRVTSPYDCSGQHFTMWLIFHRNPSGLISYTHRIGIDV